MGCAASTDKHALGAKETILKAHAKVSDVRIQDVDEARVLKNPRLSQLQDVFSSASNLVGYIEENIKVQSWDSAQYEFVTKLQDAPRNQGQVDLMKEKGSFAKRAVKLLPNTWMTASPKEFAQKYPRTLEWPWYDIGLVKALSALPDPFVCDLYGVFANTSRTFVVTSFASEGDLFTWCNQDPSLVPAPGLEREKLMKPLMSQLLNATSRLHDLGVAHRDISLENVLLTTDASTGKLQVKLIDFGMCSLSRTCTDGVRGKGSYQAPEMHRASPYDAFLSDAFALGVVLYAAAVADYPWNSTTKGSCQLFDFISQFGLRKFLEKRKLRDDKQGATLIMVLSPEFVELLEGLLALDPMKRLTLGESVYGDRKSVWEMEWLKGWRAPMISLADARQGA